MHAGGGASKCLWSSRAWTSFRPSTKSSSSEPRTSLRTRARRSSFTRNCPARSSLHSARPPASDPTDYRTYLHSRPAQAEDEAIALLRRRRGYTARTSTWSISLGDAIEIVRGSRLSAETTPHYLHLTQNKIRGRARVQVSTADPRTRESRAALAWTREG